MSKRYVLATDGDSHWFVIPADKRDEWSEYCDAAEKYWWDIPENEEPPVQPDWADEVGGKPSLVTFANYEIS
jgi:hypothetical protein